MSLACSRCFKGAPIVKVQLEDMSQYQLLHIICSLHLPPVSVTESVEWNTVLMSSLTLFSVTLNSVITIASLERGRLVSLHMSIYTHSMEWTEGPYFGEIIWVVIWSHRPYKLYFLSKCWNSKDEKQMCMEVISAVFFKNPHIALKEHSLILLS